MSLFDPAVVFSFANLWRAAHRTARGKRHRPAVARFMLDLERELLRLRDDILGGLWRPLPPRRMVVHDPKPRRISVPAFRDRVMQQCLVAAIGPRVERRLIADTYACRVGAGTHAALERARAWARTWRWWVRLDVQRYFPSIDHAIVREHLAKDVPLRALRELCERVLDAAGTPGSLHVAGDDLFTPAAHKVGLPLGNLTSQLWANRYLDPVDHLVKDRLRHRGYLRYMDDMLLFDDDRARLEALARTIEGACGALRLRLHPWCVHPTEAGVGFVGYRIYPRYVRVKRTTVRRAEKRLGMRLGRGETLADEPFRDGFRATLAHWDHADSWRLKEKVLRRLGLLYAPGEEE